jgi:molybdopterin-guanine dinucleotide biosynthesis protein A
MSAKEPTGHADGAGAIVLAGGKSARMGTPKALLRFDDTPLIEHIVGALRERFAEVIVVAAPDQALPPLPATLVRDEIAHQGPASGLYYGLRAARPAVSFVTSCDAAFLNLDVVSYLVDQAPGHDAVVPRWHGRDQPLHAVYRRTVLPALEAQLSRGERRVGAVLDRVRTRRVAEEEIRSLDPEGASFFNMNTPEDYAEAQRRWDARREARRPGVFRAKSSRDVPPRPDPAEDASRSD